MNKDKKWLEWCIKGADLFSTCEKKQYMALIVDKNGMLESTGYNGSPKGFEHCIEGCPRFVNNVPSGGSYGSGDGLCYAIHAEINCLLHSDATRRKNGTMYVNGFPCFDCAKAIANSGIDKIVIKSEIRPDSDKVKQLLEKANIEVKITPSKSEIVKTIEKAVKEIEESYGN